MLKKTNSVQYFLFLETQYICPIAPVDASGSAGGKGFLRCTGRGENHFFRGGFGEGGAVGHVSVGASGEEQVHAGKVFSFGGEGESEIVSEVDVCARFEQEGDDLVVILLGAIRAGDEEGVVEGGANVREAVAEQELDDFGAALGHGVNEGVHDEIEVEVWVKVAVLVGVMAKPMLCGLEAVKDIDVCSAGDVEAGEGEAEG